MKKYLLIGIIVMVFLVGCSVTLKPTSECIIGVWTGMQTSANGDKVPATWEFIEGGTMLVEVAGGVFSYGATWEVNGNRINIVTELDPEKPTYRDVEFKSNDVMVLTKLDIVETWQRQ